MRTRAFVLVILGCCWLAGDLYLIVGNIILRETPLGVIATALDRLPTAVANPILILLWLILLFGWIVPLALSLKHLRHQRVSK
jgi:uncharacterized protein with PQ loop repeat